MGKGMVILSCVRLFVASVVLVSSVSKVSEPVLGRFSRSFVVRCPLPVVQKSRSASAIVILLYHYHHVSLIAKSRWIDVILQVWA